MGFWKGFNSSERDAKRNKQSLHKHKKQMDNVMREMQAKIDTIESNITRTDEKLLEQQGLAVKFARYIEKTEQPTEKSRFQMQKETAEREVEKLQNQKYDLETELVPFQQSYDRMKHVVSESVDHLDALEREASAHKGKAEMEKYAAKEEEKMQFELAEAEALLELRSEK